MDHELSPAIVVGALIFDRMDRVLLARFPKWSGKWAIPAGKVQYSEPMLSALRREVLEETGLMIHQPEFLRIGESILPEKFRDGSWHLILIDFVVKSFEGDVKVDEREFDHYKWVSLDAALQMDLTPPTRETLLCWINNQRKSPRAPS